MSSTLKSVWEFIKYHKKKFIALALTCALGVGGFYFMKRALLAKLAEVGEMGKALEQKRRKEMELARLRGECTDTITKFLSPLRKQLNKLTDVIPITTQLKELRAKQKARKALTNGKKTEEDLEDEKQLDKLWEDLKVFSLARLITSVYALTLLDLLLRVQLHVAAKKALEEHEKGTEAKITQKVREQFMFKATDFFVLQGLTTLLQRVEKGIRIATKSWQMGTDAEVTKIEIVEMVKRIRGEIENIQPGDEELNKSAHTWFLSCLIQPDEAIARAKEDAGLDASQAEELKAMLDETMDLLESPHFAAVLEEALSTLFGVLLEDLHARQFEGKKEVVSSSPKAAPPSPPVGAPTREEKYILAKVIVGIKLFAKYVLATSEADIEEGDDAITTESNRYVHKLETLPALEELSRAILNITADDVQGLEGLGEMKDLLPLLASIGGQGGAGGAGPDLAGLLPLLAGQAGAPGAPGAGDANNLLALLQQQQQQQQIQDTASAASRS